jgi:hypothetical protein
MKPALLAVQFEIVKSGWVGHRTAAPDDGQGVESMPSTCDKRLVEATPRSVDLNALLRFKHHDTFS